ncbi:hypothetical protein NADE_004582 [Nannochloris sp. 'desiccata']|nr:hypothetical protein KSW81_006921 [Chlorella desiccata (nom. nud.)]KAH7621988.1 hypothetical protein NADE_004582 [Chlorella desiccata (nom. nud.)]
MISPWSVNTRTSGSLFQGFSFGRQSKKLAHARIARRTGGGAGEITTATAEMSASSFIVPPTVFPPPLPKLDASYEAACSFSSYANWLIPGYVMLGRYPYVEPSRCHTRNEGDIQIEAIMREGVSTFVCLQAELPPQEEMRLAGVDGFLSYRAAAQLCGAALSDPPTFEEVNGLRNRDLDKFLPPRKRTSDYVNRRRIEPEFLHCPIVDLGIAEEDQLINLLNELTERLKIGEKLYVHCWGGRGRAGTIGAALLAKLYGVDADEALERVQRAFDTRSEQRQSPETPQQHTFVKDFIANKRYEA